MLDTRPVVLKFGGSVLRDERALRQAVHEIYRWRRAGHGVVAVVSALAGRTDALLAKSRQLCRSAAPHAVAALLATGEHEAAALLGCQLDRAGVPSCVLSPARDLAARGDALDATPVDFDPRATRAALARDEVVIVPGFIAADAAGRTVTLGRGGSDLTALFLAHALGARLCRLIKDVDGLYERDPARRGPRPRRFARATWDDALTSDGSILQHKALRFARERRIRFELGGLNGERPTRVGSRSSAWSDGGEPAPRPLRVILAGLGTVGGGVYELLEARADAFEVTAVVVGNPRRVRETRVPAALLRASLDRRTLAGADVLVEAVGGTLRAGELVESALRAGLHVVSANKELLASHGPGLAALARAHGRTLAGSAAAGGGVPVLERIAALGPHVHGVRAVLNGTTNFVLERMAAGLAQEQALAQAREAGFAEGDATRDLSGLDAAHKLCLIARALGVELAPGQVECAPWSEEGVAAPGHWKQIASLSLDRHAGSTSGSVRLESLPAGDPLRSVRGESNAAVVELAGGGQVVLRGRGAGRWPTAESVLGDLLALARDGADAPRRFTQGSRAGAG